MESRLQAYLKAQSSSPLRHVAEELLRLAVGWVPGVTGIATRAPLWRLLIKGNGYPAIESGVIIKNSRWITLGENVFLDRNVYLHGGSAGLCLGDRTRVMFGAEINVYNFRGLSGSSIETGRDCVIGPGCVITGQGGAKIGDDVIIGPKVLILPADHHYDKPDSLIREQGLKLRGIRIGNNVWVGGGAIILGGANVGEGAVIAAGAVVNDEIPPKSLAAGNPARIVKQWTAGS